MDHPDFALFPMEFKREAGKVTEAWHGSNWYVSDGYSGPQSFDYPQEWDAYAGHYRARNLEVSKFRGVIRQGLLTLILPWGAVEPLQPLGEGLFHVGADIRSPETLRFQEWVGGRTLRADYSGCPYYRAFTE